MSPWKLVLIGILGWVFLSPPALRAADLLRVEGAIVKWPSPPAGTTTVISYAMLTSRYLVTRNTRTLSPDNCGAMQPFSDIVARSADVTTDSSKQELRAALAAWEAVADVKFVETSDPATAHIVIGATETSAGPAFANLRLHGRRGLEHSADKALGGARASGSAGPAVPFDDKSIAMIEQAFVCLNPRARWKIGFDGNLKIYDLRHTFMHEIGHALGLDHPGPSGTIMGFRYDERVMDLQTPDIQAIQRLYGPSRDN